MEKKNKLINVRINSSTYWSQLSCSLNENQIYFHLFFISVYYPLFSALVHKHIIVKDFKRKNKPFNACFVFNAILLDIKKQQILFASAIFYLKLLLFYSYLGSLNAKLLK